MSTRHTTFAAPGAEPSPALAPSHTIRFARGLPGFESCRTFVLMAPEDDGTLQYLTSSEGPHASFLVMDPRRVDPAYACELTDVDRRALGADAETPLLWLVLVMVEPDGTVTVNLRAPIVINPVRMVGQQIIPHQSPYPLRHVLVPGE